jgi:ubiquinone/menaquinone biosynthesis C-methylase UbiE
MSQSDAVFSGRIPELYDQNLGGFMFEPFAFDLARRISITEGRLLEIAAGTGIGTLALASSLPAAVTIVASDLNPAMLDFAQTKTGMERVSWEQAEALALPFADAEFHVAVCQFGVMFFPIKSEGSRTFDAC